MAAFWPIGTAQIIRILSYRITKKVQILDFSVGSVIEMYLALLPKTDYRDKGRRHDRRPDVSWLLLSVSSLSFSVSLSLFQMSSASLPFSEARILPALHNRTHKTALGGMGASVRQAHETLN